MEQMFRIGQKLLTATEAKAEVARLRSLPDEQIAALNRAGLIEEWNIAIGLDPSPESSWKAAWSEEKPSGRPPTPAPATAQRSKEREPLITRERRAELEAKIEALRSALDVAGFAAVTRTSEYATLLVEKAREESRDRPSAFAVQAERLLTKTLLEREQLARAALEKRVAELEQRMGATRMNEMAYRGVFREGDLYRQNELVTYQGALWHCKTMTHDRPGSSDWQMMTKTR